MSEYHRLTKKLHARVSSTLTQYCFWCPACGESHHYNGLNMEGKPILWEFNGDVEKPSFTPSLKVTGVDAKTGKPDCCHLFLTDGKIHYCGDCTHDRAGQVVDLPDYPWDES